MYILYIKINCLKHYKNTISHSNKMEIIVNKMELKPVFFIELPDPLKIEIEGSVLIEVTSNINGV